jgi:hypothetical protein
VARLLGEANLLPVRSAGPRGVCLAGGLPLRQLPDDPGRYAAGQLVLLRPEACSLAAGGGGPNCWPGRVVTRSFLGADQLVEVEVAADVTVRVRLRADAMAPAPGEVAHVVVPPEAVWLIPERDPEGAADVTS